MEWAKREYNNKRNLSQKKYMHYIYGKVQWQSWALMDIETYIR